MNKTESKWLHNFVTAILSLETEEECENFFEDICSAIITRVNKCLVYGAGGYKTVLEKNGNFADGEVTEER